MIDFISTTTTIISIICVICMMLSMCICSDNIMFSNIHMHIMCALCEILLYYHYGVTICNIKLVVIIWCYNCIDSV